MAISSAFSASAGGKIMLAFDGAPDLSGQLLSISGGAAKAEKVENDHPTDHHKQITLGNLSFEPIQLKFNGSVGKALASMMKETFNRNPKPVNGSFMRLDLNGKVLEECAFTNAWLSSLGFSAFDAAAKSQMMQIDVTLDPEECKWTFGSGAVQKADRKPNQKVWLASNFEVKIDGIESKYMKLEGLKLSQKVVSEPWGHTRVAVKAPSSCTVDAFKVTCPIKDRDAWHKWYNEFVIQGNHGQEHHKNGSIELKDPALGKSLLKVDLFDIGITSIAPSAYDTKGDSTASFVAELYCERAVPEFLE